MRALFQVCSVSLSLCPHMAFFHWVILIHILWIRALNIFFHLDSSLSHPHSKPIHSPSQWLFPAYWYISLLVFILIVNYFYIPRGGHGNLLQYSYLENPMDRGTLWATVHRAELYSSTVRHDWSHLTHTFILFSY